MSLFSGWIRVVGAGVVVAGVVACARPAADTSAAGVPQLVTSDVENFVAWWSVRAPGDTSCVELDAYLASASEGLREYQRRFKVDRDRICRAIARHPERYETIPAKLAAIDSVRDSVTVVLARMAELVPSAQWPPVYFVVGNGVSGGSAFGGRRPMMLIGTELMGRADALPRLIAHEAAHTQQRHGGIRRLSGGPRFLRASVLRQAIKEGAADFIAELATGIPPSGETFAYGMVHEAALWEEFRRDMLGTEYRRWLYNGWNREELGGRPPDLAYFFGYRITQAYYGRATDKAQAIRDILTIRNFERFLEESGYGSVHRLAGHSGDTAGSGRVP